MKKKNKIFNEKKRAIKKAIFILVLLFGTVGSVQAEFDDVKSPAFWIIGNVTDSEDGIMANGRTAFLWYDNESKNAIDTIGPSGTSGVNNGYMIDAEEILKLGELKGKILHVRVIDNGDGYTAGPVDVEITQDDINTGYAFAPDMILVREKREVLIISCVVSGEERNQFAPGESVYVKGQGLLPNTDYTIWIQNHPVKEGGTLDTCQDPSSYKNSCDLKNQEIVTTNKSGYFDPILIWDIPSSAKVTYSRYDIVVDNGDRVYKSDDDGVDGLGVEGFVAPVPELSTLTFIGVGMLLLVGYVGYIKRRG